MKRARKSVYGDQADTTKVSDKEGMTKVGKEAVEVWRRHFEEVLNEGQDSGEQYEPERVKIGNDQDSLLNEIITREEVKQALDSLKQRATPGRDGLTTEMVSSESLMVFWWELFNWCWKVVWSHQSGGEASLFPCLRKEVGALAYV